jgi:hypothetical protein
LNTHALGERSTTILTAPPGGSALIRKSAPSGYRAFTWGTTGARLRATVKALIHPASEAIQQQWRLVQWICAASMFVEQQVVIEHQVVRGVRNAPRSR